MSPLFFKILSPYYIEWSSICYTIGFYQLSVLYMGFPDSLVGKESACNEADSGLISGWERPCWRRDRLPTPVFLGFPCGSAGKESDCNVGDLGLIPGFYIY